MVAYTLIYQYHRSTNNHPNWGREITLVHIYGRNKGQHGSFDAHMFWWCSSLLILLGYLYNLASPIPTVSAVFGIALSPRL